jgi:hypothetical protein
VTAPIIRTSDPGAAAPAASLAAFAAGFRRALPAVGEVARTVLTTDVAGAGGLFAILGEVARISGVALFCHWIPLSFLLKPPGLSDPAWIQR